MEITYENNGIAVCDFGVREIKYAFHDIDGTHSLTKVLPPVMSIVLNYVSESGMPKDTIARKISKR